MSGRFDECQMDRWLSGDDGDDGVGPSKTFTLLVLRGWGESKI